MCGNTEFTDQPICTASRKYQNFKIKQLEDLHLPDTERQIAFNTITEKICLCEGLCSSAYLKYKIARPKENTAVAICPGPNLAYFKKTFSLEEMAGHIYGKLDILKNAARPHMLIKELELYIDYLQKDIQQNVQNLTEKKGKQLFKFKEQLISGINYYKILFTKISVLPGNVVAQLQSFEDMLLNQPLFHVQSSLI